jgi:hypothetical protein
VLEVGIILIYDDDDGGKVDSGANGNEDEGGDFSAFDYWDYIYLLRLILLSHSNHIVKYLEFG